MGTFYVFSLDLTPEYNDDGVVVRYSITMCDDSFKIKEQALKPSGTPWYIL